MQSTARAPVTEITGIPVKTKKDWETAAARRGISLIDFLTAAVNDAMETLPEESNEIKLSVRDQIQIAEALTAPPRPLGGVMQKAIEGALDRMDEQSKNALKKRLVQEVDV